MIQWPESLTIGPLREWPGVMTPGPRRKAAPFSATLASTLDTLHREIRSLADTVKQERTAELLVAIPAGAFRQDGRPYANAKAEHPGVVFSMESRHGRLSYPSDRFLTWEDNLRAVALSLESLRRVDRYGVTAHGEQYRGFLELDAAPAAGALESAYATIAILSMSDTASVKAAPGVFLTRAKRHAHPDRGGKPEQWHAVVEAEDVLRKAGRL